MVGRRKVVKHPQYWNSHDAQTFLHRVKDDPKFKVKPEDAHKIHHAILVRLEVLHEELSILEMMGDSLHKFYDGPVGARMDVNLRVIKNHVEDMIYPGASE